MTGPTMFDQETGFAGIRLRVDPINRQREEDSDNVMAMFQEEQPFTWQFVTPYVRKALNESPGKIGFLDVGTGSGVFSILIAKHFPGTNIVAIDKSARAIHFAQENAKLNDVTFELRHETYTQTTVPPHSCRVIGLYPPYHLYPEEVSDLIPQHARGGSDGQGEFVSQLVTAAEHVAQNGIVFFNQMCVGDAQGPAFRNYIRELFPNASFEWTQVFPAMDTKKFLEGVYAGRQELVYQEYVRQMNKQHPLVYYTVGVICNDGRGESREITHSIDLLNRSWSDRIELHHQIAAHAF